MSKFGQDRKLDNIDDIELCNAIPAATQAERLEYLIDMLKELQSQADSCRAETLAYVIGLAVLEASEQLNLCKFDLDLKRELISGENFETVWKLKA